MTETREWLTNVRQDLEKRKTKLENDLQQSQEIDTDSENNKDLGDQAFSSSMDALKNSLQDANYKEYNMIVKALEAINDTNLFHWVLHAAYFIGGDTLNAFLKYEHKSPD